LNAQGGFAKYNTKTSTWGYDDSTKAGTVTGTITSFYYYVPTIATDQLIVGGAFTWTAGGITATNIAQFDWSAETIKAFPTGAGAPTTRVNALGYAGKQLYIGGEGPVSGDISYIRQITFDGTAGTTYAKIGTSQSDITQIPQFVRDLWVCDTTDCAANSNTGAVAFVGPSNMVRFYVKKTDTYYSLGTGTNGEAYCVTSAFLLNGSATTALSFIVLIASAVFAIMF